MPVPAGLGRLSCSASGRWIDSTLSSLPQMSYGGPIPRCHVLCAESRLFPFRSFLMLCPAWKALEIEVPFFPPP